jgi:predicted nucleic acid-binding protein
VRVLLDTSVLLGAEPDLGEADVAISTISLAELHFGVLVARTAEVRAERLRRLGLIEKTFDALPVDDAVAREYGRLAAAVAQAGRQPRARVADLLIAATARAHAAELWTRNGDDFIGLEPLITIRSITA